MWAIAWVLVRLITGLRRHQPNHQDSDIEKNHSNHPVFRAFFILGFIYLAIYTTAAIFSIDPKLSLGGTNTRQGTLTVFTLVIYSMLVADTVRSFTQADRLITGILIGSVPVALYGCLQYIGLDLLRWTTNSLSKVHSTTGYSLFLGAYLAMVIPFTLARSLDSYRAGKRTRLASYAIILAIQTICLLFTLARSAVLALLIGCLIFFMLAVRFRHKWAFVLLTASIVLAGGVILLAINNGWVIIPASQQSRLSRSLIIETRSLSNLDRLTLWKLTLPLLRRRILLGYGPETYSPAFSQYYQTETYPLDTVQKNPTVLIKKIEYLVYWDPHNLIFAQILSVGVIGLTIFILILSLLTLRTFRFIRKESDRSKVIIAAALLGSIAAYIIQAQLNPSGFVPTAIFWLVIGICAGLPTESPNVETHTFNLIKRSPASISVSSFLAKFIRT